MTNDGPGTVFSSSNLAEPDQNGGGTGSLIFAHEAERSRAAPRRPDVRCGPVNRLAVLACSR
jgi:hypothetical protein